MKLNFNWILHLLPLLLLTLFVTGAMSLFQNIFPLDLTNLGIIRPTLADSRVASLITIKLILLAILQWPVGYLISDLNSSYKFRLCLISLLIGFIILSLSNFFINGYILILIAYISLTISLSVFLPSASDTIKKSSPISNRGNTILIYSQCLGIGSLTLPWIAGRLIDKHGTAIKVYLLACIFCILLLPICKNIK